MVKQWQHQGGWSLTIRIENGAPPVYQQLVDQIRFHIASGNLQPGDKLPTVRDLASALEIDGNFRDMIPDETDFDPLRSDPLFQSLVGLSF